MNNWLVIDKLDDFLYFNKLEDIAVYFNLTKNQVYAVYMYNIIHINKYSPSKDIYIQKLFNCPSLTPRDYSKVKYNWWALKFVYNKILIN